jgi:hypothetical protein
MFIIGFIPIIGMLWLGMFIGIAVAGIMVGLLAGQSRREESGT